MAPPAGIRGLLYATILLACSGAPPAQQTGKRLWVLKEPGEIIEYDIVTFVPKRTIQVPPEILESPENLRINRKGQMLFAPVLQGGYYQAGQGFGIDRVWFHDGRSAALIDRGATNTRRREGANLSVVQGAPNCSLSKDGTQLFWFENLFRKIVTPDDSGDISVRTTFRAWTTDLSGGSRTPIAAFDFAPCKCETGVCSESCPQADVWTSEGGLDSYFVVTHFVPGQIGARYEASSLYRNSGGRWSETRLPEALELILDAVQDGEIIVYAVPDSGCCGWDNVVNDQTILRKGGAKLTLFDERARYANFNYEVGFRTSNAKLSPDARSIAMTIATAVESGTEFRLSPDGKPDAKELARLRQALEALPAVEVLRLDGSPKRTAFLPRATLSGWLDDREILIVEDGALTAFNTSAGSRRKSQVKISNPSQVFVR